MFIYKKRKILFVFFALFFLGACSVFKPVKNQGEPRFTGYFFEDRDGNDITGEIVSPKQKFVYLVVLSENSIGEKVDIDLDNPIDYIYKGNYLTDKMHFKIRHNREKLKLYIYDRKNKRHRRLKEKAMKKLFN